MKIKKINARIAPILQQEVDKGGKFVRYAFTISLIVVTFKQTSGIYLVPAGESGWGRAALFTMISALLGWWGFPWGPKYTITSLRTNLKGGTDVTDEVMAVVAGYALFEETQKSKVANQ
jgi:hypothetical protein